jgi:hypothetical protein
VATVAITITAANGDAGALLRKLANQIEAAAAVVPDRVTTGASTVLTISDAPATGVASVQITGGPYQSALFPV